MDNFTYKKKIGITALSAKMSEFSYKTHSHEEYTIGVTLQGVQEYHLDGCLQESYASGVMLFNPDQVHDGRAQDHAAGLDYVMLYIKPDLFLEALEKKEMMKFSSPIVYNRELAHNIVKLSNAILTNDDDALCNELLINVIDRFSSEDMYSAKKEYGDFIAKAKEMIYFETNGVLKLDDICNEFNMSKFKFIRTFKMNTGFSPYQFFLNAKILQAKNHLEKYKDLYATVAEFDFVDLSHFNKHFKKVYGVTAYEYLKDMK